MRVLSGVRNSSIRFKLVAMMTTSCLVGVILCCGGFVLNDLRTLHNAKARQVTSQAEMLAFNSSAVILFSQHEAAEELLSAYSAEPTVENAILYSADGQVIAAYGQSPASKMTPVQSLQSKTWLDEDGHICHVEPVSDAGELIGSLYVTTNMTDVEQQIHDYFIIAGVMTAVAVLVSTLLAMAIQGFISRPIVHLAGVATRIRQKEDYSVRVNLKRSDEMGSLIMAFNAMLSQVEHSKNELREANDQLEDRVAERTAQLQQEIVQREKTSLQLVAAKEQAEKANVAKSMFLANMSHEIRTPMNAILGFTDLLVRDGEEASPEDRADYLKTIQTSGQHLLGLINDILDLSKVEADKMELNISEESPHQIISETMSVMRVRAIQKGLSLDHTWNGPMPRHIDTDGARLRQLLLNLVGNAIKFTTDGGVRVSVTLIDLQHNPKLQIDVIDTGMGIPEHKLSEIFQPFSQADVSTTREFGGTGLGLTISRRIAEAMGGTLEAESQPGRGSTFTVVVPVGELDSESLVSTPPRGDIVPSPEPAFTAAETTSIDNTSILLVEDGQTNRRMINLLLKRYGVNVTDAENGQIGVYLATSRDFDLILMDMQMPVKDGYTATSELREKGVTTPILALTAHAMSGDREKCLNAGCDGYLTKPINEKQLVGSLSQFLANSTLKSNAAPTPEVVQPETSCKPIVSALPGDDAAYREIIEDFRIELTARLVEMNACCDRNDFEGLAKLAHWLKGTAGTAGFDHFTIPAIRLERYARAGTASSSREALNIVVGLAQLIQLPDELTANPTANESIGP